MQFASYAILLASLCGAALSSDTSFDQISKPSKGEVLQAGTMYNIKWHSTLSGDVSLMLMGQKNSEYSTDALDIIGSASPLVPSNMSYPMTISILVNTDMSADYIHSHDRRYPGPPLLECNRWPF